MLRPRADQIVTSRTCGGPCSSVNSNMNRMNLCMCCWTRRMRSKRLGAVCVNRRELVYHCLVPCLPPCKIQRVFLLLLSVWVPVWECHCLLVHFDWNMITCVVGGCQCLVAHFVLHMITNMYYCLYVRCISLYQVKLIISMDTDSNVYTVVYWLQRCLLLFCCYNIHIYWCNLLIHVISMIIVRSV